jgi:hypothetical protein
MTVIIFIVLIGSVSALAYIAGYSKGEADATEKKFKNLS